MLGFLFIAVTLFMPQGVVGLLKKREASIRPEVTPPVRPKPVPRAAEMAEESAV